jgi:hypothetical protein
MARSMSSMERLSPTAEEFQGDASHPVGHSMSRHISLSKNPAPIDQMVPSQSNAATAG